MTVGSFLDGTINSYGFIRDAAGNFTLVQDPDNLSPSGVLGINDNGVLVGIYLDLATGLTHGYVATPAPGRAGDMNCDGVVNFADYNLFVEALGDTEEEWNAAHPGCPYLNADINGDGLVNLADINPFAGLGYGNAAAARTYTWDGENRLVRVEPTDGTFLPAGTKRLTFVYDYQGRRIRKQVETYSGTYPNGQWSVTEVRAFVYQGWRIVLELDARDLNSDGVPDNTVLRKYTWGLDLAGQNGSINSLEGDGGIGGLLAVEEPQNVGDPHRYVYFYDANGNVGQVADLFAADPNAALKARYEYDPYGNLTVQSGPYADANPFRWSTKYFDVETGLSDFGGRYYNASLGRWINRDPAEELGGANLYAYVGNDPIDRVDYLGRMAKKPCPRGVCGCPKDDPATSQPEAKPATQPQKKSCQEQLIEDLKEADEYLNDCSSHAADGCTKTCSGCSNDPDWSSACETTCATNRQNACNWQHKVDMWMAQQLAQICAGGLGAPPPPGPPPRPTPDPLPDCAQKKSPPSQPTPTPTPRRRPYRPWHRPIYASEVSLIDWSSWEYSGMLSGGGI